MQEIDSIYKVVAENLGREIDAKRVYDLAEKTVTGGHIVHGVKRIEALIGILENGVLPSAPEGGMASYWTSGLRMFTATDNPQSGFIGYDSSIFHYANRTLVLTNNRILSNYGIRFYGWNGAAVTIHKTVPRSAVAILEVGDGIGKNVPEALFELLEKVLDKGYQGGEFFRD